MPQTPPFATYVSYEEFSGESCSLDEFRSWIQRFSKNHVVYACGLINAFLETWQGEINSTAHENLIRDAFWPNDADRILGFCRVSDHPRFVFHRLQLLFVEKEAILLCSAEGINPMQTPHWGGLGLGLLMANDLLHNEFQERIGSPERTLERIATWIPALEYSGKYTFKNKISRTKLMLTQFSPPDSNFGINQLDELSINTTGVNLQTFMSVCIGVLSHYLYADYEQLRQNQISFRLGPSYFSNTDIDSEELRIVLNELSSDGDSLKVKYESRNGGLSDFTWFRDTPLYRWNPESVFALDTRFLAEKIGNGIFWRIHNALPSNQEKHAFHQFWGDSFENYCNWLIGNSVNDKLNRFYPSPKFSTSGHEVCDGIIVCGTEAIFLEYKGHTFTAKSKYSGDLGFLSEEIEKHFLGLEERPKGVRQLTGAILKVFGRDNPQRVENVDLSEIKTIYPVLVTRDEIGDCFFLNPYLNDKARSFFNRKVVRPRLVTPFFCLSIEALETVSPYLMQARFTDLLKGWYRQAPDLRSSFLSLFGTNAVVASIGDIQNENLQQAFDVVWEDAQNTLFPNQSLEET